MVRALPWVLGGSIASLPLLATPTSWSRIGVFVAHLSALVLFAIALAMRVVPLVDGSWFAGTRWRATTRRLAAGVTVVLLVTGFTGVVTMASGAALRLQPSLQYLQLLSALDIAWAATAVVVGLYAWRGAAAARLGGTTLGVLCVLSVWNYLRVVGLAEDGGWLLRGSELMRLVIPFDVMAAIVAGVVLVVGLRHSPTPQPMEQLSPQS